MFGVFAVVVDAGVDVGEDGDGAEGATGLLAAGFMNVFFFRTTRSRAI